MRILVEMTHPAQVHFFKNAIGILQSGGQQVMIASRHKECLTQLLDELHVEHRCLSRQSSGLVGLGWELLRRDLKMLNLVRRFRPDVLVGRFCISAGLAGFCCGKPVVVFEDTEHARLQQKISLPFASVICSTTHYAKDWGKRHVRYDSFDHLAYTHPRYFQPNPAILSKLGLSPGEPFSLLRLVSWRAAHDRGVQGLRGPVVEELIKTLQSSGRVLLSSEGELPRQFSHLRMLAPPGEMLNLMAFARIYVGEGSTMAAEAACLGVPAVYVNRLKVGNLRQMQERYGLVRCVLTGAEAAQAAREMLDLDPACWATQRQRLLDDSQDVTEFVVNLVQRVGRGEAPIAAATAAATEGLNE